MVKKTLIQSIDRALEAMNIIMSEKRPMRSSEIAVRMGLEPRTMHNIIRSLYLHGYLAQDEDSRYLLGPECFRLYNAAKSPFDKLGAAARAPVCELTRQTGNTSFLGCEYYGVLYCVVLAHESGFWEVNGKQDWLNLIHATAAGKIIIAEKGLDWFDNICRKEKLERFTDQTIMDSKTMMPEIEKIPKVGYALSINEHLPNLAAIAIPVKRRDGTLVGSLAQSFPDYLIEAGKIKPEERARVLYKTAEKIIANLENG